jgi:hypothetical protein
MSISINISALLFFVLMIPIIKLMVEFNHEWSVNRPPRKAMKKALSTTIAWLKNPLK